MGDGRSGNCKVSAGRISLAELLRPPNIGYRLLIIGYSRNAMGKTYDLIARKRTAARLTDCREFEQPRMDPPSPSLRRDRQRIDANFRVHESPNAITWGALRVAYYHLFARQDRTKSPLIESLWCLWNLFASIRSLPAIALATAGAFAVTHLET
jgi:hypothetical protein